MTDTEHSGSEKGLRILARMIASAYLEDMCSKHSSRRDLENEIREGNNGNKRRIRSGETAPAGQN